MCGRYFGDTRNVVASDFVDQFSALGQPGRLKIFRLLVRAGPQGLCVEDIKRRVPMPGSTLSHHLDSPYALGPYIGEAVESVSLLRGGLGSDRAADPLSD